MVGEMSMSKPDRVIRAKIMGDLVRIICRMDLPEQRPPRQVSLGDRIVQSAKTSEEFELIAYKRGYAEFKRIEYEDEDTNNNRVAIAEEFIKSIEAGVLPHFPRFKFEILYAD
jgi:hypothetical protein